MKLRTKLLVLLLLVSVIPTLTIGFFGFSSLATLGKELGNETAEVLLDDAEIRLKELVDENARLIGLSTAQLDMAVRVQQVAAAEALTSLEPKKQKLYSVESFDNPSAAPPNLITLSMFDCKLSDGTILECPVSYQTQAIIRADGVQEEIARLQSHQLQQMNSTYRALSIDPGLPAMRYFTATVDGMGGTFPGHGGMPEGYDPRNREWYKRAITSDGEVVHTTPNIDASTLRIVVASVAPIYSPEGVLLGATGVDKSVIDVLHEISIPREWKSESFIRIVVPKGNKLNIIASQDMSDGPVDWNASLQIEELFEETKSFKQLMGHLLALDTGIMDYNDGAKELVVAFAPITGMHASLMVSVPKHVIEAKAIAEEEVVFQKTINHTIVIVIFSVSIIIIVLIISLIVSRM